MEIRIIQQLLMKAGRYKGAIDGDAGPGTMAGVYAIESSNRSKYSRNPQYWSKARRLIGAAQTILNAAGYEAGTVDGYSGHNTELAMDAWISQTVIGKPMSIKIDSSTGAHSDRAQMAYPRQRDMTNFYGKAGGNQCTNGKVDLAYPMKIAWNKRQTIKRFSCHEKVAAPLTAIFRETLSHYGMQEVKKLELDIYGGCYNYRKKRGGRTLSTHAYGVAVDLNPEKNQLRWGKDRAQFAKAEYEPFWKIVMANGGTPAGYAWGKDWMHFQFASL